MKKLLIILLSFWCLLGCSQSGTLPSDPHPGYFPVKGEGYALRDAEGRIIATEDGGILYIVRVKDTSSTDLVLPPDTAQVFDIAVGGVGEPFTSLMSEIRSYWTLEEAAGNAVDSVGIADLPVYGGVTRQQTGKIDDCYSFTTNGYLGNIDSFFEFDGEFTLACWIKTSTADDFMGVMTNYGSDNFGYDLLLSSGVPNWNIRGGSGLTTTSSGGGDLRDNNFYHLVASLGADDSLKVYVDGVLVDKDYTTHGTAYNTDNQFEVGSRDQAHFFEGSIDEPATWNRELTQTEVDSLFAESQYPFSAEGSGGDSLNMILEGVDERLTGIDSIIVNYKFGGIYNYPTSRFDGTEQFAFEINDLADYVDTTFLWADHKDTIANFTAWTKLFTGEITAVPNKDTVLIDSSDIIPPDQDIGVWDTILWVDFEEYTDAPIYWSRNLFLTQEITSSGDLWDAWEMNGEDHWRAEDFRYPQWFQDNIDDSIVVDPITGSKVLRLMFAGGFHEGYDGQSGRGGEFWKTPLPGAPYTEVYFSVNIMLNPGWMEAATGGGKMFPFIQGGTFSGHGGTQYYGEGFRGGIMWDHHSDRKGGLAFYWYDQDTQEGAGRWYRWNEFQPTGGGLTASMYDNPYGTFMYPTVDSTWYNITVRCVTNTHTGSTNNKNGILEGYVNGRLIHRISGMNMITYPDVGDEINVYNFYNAFGGAAPPLPTRDEWSFWDDLVVFTYDESVEDVPRGNELSQPGRILSLPNWPKTSEE